MSIDQALWTGHGLAVMAAAVGLVSLFLGRRSAARPVVVTMSVVMALSGMLAGVRLIDLQPTHALLTDSESTKGQTVRYQSDAPEERGDAEPVTPLAERPEDTRGDTDDSAPEPAEPAKPAKPAHQGEDSAPGQPRPEATAGTSPEPGPAEPGAGPSEPAGPLADDEDHE